MPKKKSPPREHMKETEQSYLTPEEAAEFLMVSKPTIHRWINEGKLEGWKTSKTWNSRVWVTKRSVVNFIKTEQKGREVPAALR